MAAAGRVMWIGGAQWTGKSSVARVLAMRHGLVHYAYDYHDARSHLTRAVAEPHRYPHRAETARRLADPDFYESWVTSSPRKLAERARLEHVERFDMVVNDLAALPGCATVVAEGWGLRPDLVAPLLDAPEQAVFLVPSDEFVERQLATLERAGVFFASVSDPDGAQRNRVARDRLLAHDVLAAAQRCGLRVITITTSLNLAAVTDLVEAQFRPFLPAWLY
jgi:hypothetical protein